jgi:hypothetical protein
MSIGGFVVLSVIACGYFAPTIIAYRRNHNHKTEIAGWNAVLGWTAIVWAAAFTWALDGDVSPRPERVQREPVFTNPLSLPWLVAIGLAAVVLFVLFG